MIDLTKGVQQPYYHIRLTRETKLDMAVWLSFLEQYNGRTFFLEERWLTSTPFELITDAAGSKGYGAILGKHWLCGAWPEAWKVFNITFLELFPIVIALHVWGREMSNNCVIFSTDNAALVDIINQQSSKHPLVMILIRDLVLTSLKHNIVFRARHIPGVHNTRADLISRFQVERSKEISSGMDGNPTPVPENLQPKSWSII